MKKLLKFQVRNANENDLEGVMRAEQHWPREQRGSIEKFQSRLNRFPQGFFVTEAAGEIVAVSTSTLVNYCPDDLSKFQSWEICTNDGFLFPIQDIRDYNALFIVSEGIVKSFRRKGIREAMSRAQIGLANRLGMEYTIIGAMLPGYDAFCRKHGETEVSKYAVLKKNGRFIDPTLRKLHTLGFELPDASHLIKDYYPSPESRNYGPLLVHRVQGDKR